MVSKSELLFEQWQAQLQDKDRSRNAVQGNFEELFETLKSEGLVFESAYEYLDKAIKAHLPDRKVIKNTYKKIKTGAGSKLDQSEKEFEEAWIKSISDKGKAVFFDVFPIKTKLAEEKEEPVIYGSMTAREYKAQRSHADAYPKMNLDEVRQKIQKAIYDPMKDIDVLLGKDNSGDAH